MAQRTKRTSLARVLRAGGVCAAAVAANWIDVARSQELAAPGNAEYAAVDDGPSLTAPRVAELPQPQNRTARRSIYLFELPEAPDAPRTSTVDEEETAPVGPATPPGSAEDTTADPRSPTAAPELTPELEKLRNRMKAAAEFFSQRPENAANRDPWSVMHALIAYGANTELIAGNQRVNAIGWMLWNGNCKGQQLLYLNNGGIGAWVDKPGTQGHAGQFLAMLAQWRIRPETPMKIQGRDFTVADFIEYEKRTCEPNTELTFKLIAFSYYLESDATWKDEHGRTWSIPRLIQEELNQRVVGSACGGTHRMMGFSYAVRMRERDGKPLDGQWARAKEFVDDYQQYTFGLQNPDGSHSSNWFAGRGDWGDSKRQLETTGHTFEWLAFSLPEDKLFDPRMVKMGTFLTELLIENRNQDLAVGPKGHALHGLNIYLDRAFKTKAEYITPAVARRRAEERR